MTQSRSGVPRYASFAGRGCRVIWLRVKALSSCAFGSHSSVDDSPGRILIENEMSGRLSIKSFNCSRRPGFTAAAAPRPALTCGPKGQPMFRSICR